MNITINGLPYEVEEGLTILEAAHSVGIKIPTLCWLKEINEIGACRICLVEANGRLVASCVIKAEEGDVYKRQIIMRTAPVKWQRICRSRARPSVSHPYLWMPKMSRD